MCSIEVRFDSDDFCFASFRSEFRERFKKENPSNKSVAVVRFLTRSSFYRWICFFMKFWMLFWVFTNVIYGGFEIGWESWWKGMESSLWCCEDFASVSLKKININLNLRFDFKIRFWIYVYFRTRLHSLLRLISWRRSMRRQCVLTIWEL